MTKKVRMDKKSSTRATLVELYLIFVSQILQTKFLLDILRNTVLVYEDIDGLCTNITF